MVKHTTNINERARAILGISRDEYAYCQYVQYRSADPRTVAPGWCCDNKDAVAEFIGITRQGLYKMIGKMVEAELVEMGARGFQRVTGKWIDTETECKQSLQIAVKKVDNQCKQSLRKVSTKLTEGVNKVDVHNKVKKDKKDKGEGEREKLATLENPPTPGENPTPVEAKKEKDLVPPPPAADSPADPDPDAEPLPLTADCRPNSKTPVDLFSKLQQFYIDNPLEWKDGVLQMAKGAKYSEDQRREIVSDFCCYAIKNNHGGNTYQMLNAALQQWFRNQERAESWKGKNGGTSQAGSAAPVYTAPPKGTHQPAYVP